MPKRDSPAAPSAEPNAERRTQFAALPWRRTADGGIEVLLITSRETRRWVIPKGWPIKGKSSAKSAAREAFEEAGVKGRVRKSPIGAYTYDKRLPNDRVQHVRVTVFALEVLEETDSFPEAAQREKAWLRPEAAAKAVDEPELMVLLAVFRPEAPAS